MTSGIPKDLRFLPVGLNVRGRRCVVVGGGNVGTRKVGNLARAGADVTVVAPDRDRSGQPDHLCHARCTALFDRSR